MGLNEPWNVSCTFLLVIFPTAEFASAKCMFILFVYTYCSPFQGCCRSGHTDTKQKLKRNAGTMRV